LPELSEITASFSKLLGKFNRNDHSFPRSSQVFPATFTVTDIQANTTLLEPLVFTVAAVLKFTGMRINFLLG
jgi:hypothetical protein